MRDGAPPRTQSSPKASRPDGCREPGTTSPLPPGCACISECMYSSCDTSCDGLPGVAAGRSCGAPCEGACCRGAVRPARGVELAEAHSEVVSTPLLLLQLRQDALACGQLQAEEGAQSRRWVVALAFSPAPDIAVALNDTCIALAADVVLLVVVAVGCGPPRRRRRQQLRHQVVQALWGVLGGTAGGPMSHGRWPCHVKAVARCCQRRRRRRRWRDGCHRRSMTSGYGGRRLSSSSRGSQTPATLLLAHYPQTAAAPAPAAPAVALAAAPAAGDRAAIAGFGWARRPSAGSAQHSSEAAAQKQPVQQEHECQRPRWPVAPPQARPRRRPRARTRWSASWRAGSRHARAG
eukprot:366332-Chlamydomonas_euryale.AAC.2